MLALRCIIGGLASLGLLLSLYILLVERDYAFFQPIGVFLLLPFLLATTRYPRATPLLHATAVAITAVAIPRIPATLLDLEQMLVLGFLALWMLFYWSQVWRGAGIVFFGYAIVAVAVPAVIWFAIDYAQISGGGLAGDFSRGIVGLLLLLSLLAALIGGAIAYFGAKI